MTGWPVWLRVLAINAGLPWAALLLIRALGFGSALALLIVLTAALVILLLNIWHLRRWRRWRWGFAAVAVLNPLCTVFLGTVALATSLPSIRVILRILLGTE